MREKLLQNKNKILKAIGNYLYQKKEWTQEEKELAELITEEKIEEKTLKREEVLKYLPRDTRNGLHKLEIGKFSARVSFDNRFLPEFHERVKVKTFNRLSGTWEVPLLNKKNVKGLLLFLSRFDADLSSLVQYLFEYPFPVAVTHYAGAIRIVFPYLIVKLGFDVLKKNFPELKRVAFFGQNTLEMEIHKLNEKEITEIFRIFPQKIALEIGKILVKAGKNLERSTATSASEKARKFAEELGLSEKLFDFQKAGAYGAYEIIKEKGKVILGDKMGLGKTRQALAVVKALMKEENPFPVLVVCPKTNSYTWKEEIREVMGEDFKVGVFSGSPQENTDLSSLHFIVINYQSVRLWEKKLLKTPIRTVILDEFHYVKNPSAKTTKSVKEIVKGKKLIAISGTPFVNRVWELGDALFTLSFLRTLGMTKEDFERLFVETREIKVSKNGRTFKIKKPVKGKNLERLNLLLREVMIRREKEEVLTQLPEKIRKVIWLEIPEKELAKYRKLEEEFERELEKLKEKARKANMTLLEYLIEKDRTPVLLTKTNELLFAVSEMKIPLTVQYVKQIHEEEREKIVVFAYKKKTQERLYEELSSLKPLRIVAEMTQEEREKTIKKFQEEEENKVIIVSLGAGAEGITLTRARHLIFADLWYQPQKLLQAEDRVHRIGQTQKPVIHYLLAKNTIEEKVWKEIINSKLKEFEKAITNSPLK
ncbi:MAG: hypothetical protein DSY42_06000 [Aquifex sp.]|nr:MAG: hypothetical protein DSY42_06000 [Aquifex sp.]